MLSKRNLLIIFAFIILIGAFLRFFRLGNNSFIADEFLDVNATYGYHMTGQWQAWDFNLEAPAARINIASDERAWIYRWQVAQLYKFFPPSEAIARSVSAIWGLLTIITIYFVAKYFTGKKEIGLIAAFYFAISISGLIFDRRIRMYSMFFPIFLIFSTYLFMFFEKRYGGTSRIAKAIWEKAKMNIIYLLPMLIFGSLSFHLHQLSSNIACIFGSYILVQFFITFKRTKKINNRYSVLLIMGIVGFAIGNIFFSEEMGWLYGTIKFFNDNYQYLGRYLLDYSHPLIAAAIATLGIIYLFRIRNKDKEAVWLSASILVPLAMSIFLWRRNVGQQYIFFAQSFLIIAISAGTYWLAEFVGNNFSKISRRAFIITLAAILIILPDYGYFFQENNTYRQNSESESPNYRKIFSYFKKHHEQDEVLITRNFRNYYWSGEKIKVFSFGGVLAEEKFGMEEFERITDDNPSGWIIISENDDAFIANDVMEQIEKNFEKISNSQVRGNIKIYRWPSQP